MKRKLRFCITLLGFIIYYTALFILPDILPVNFDIDVRFNGLSPKAALIVSPSSFLVHNIIFEIVESRMKKADMDSQKVKREVSLMQTISLVICLDLIIIYGCYLYMIVKRCLEVSNTYYFDFSKLSALILSVLLIIASFLTLNVEKNEVFGFRTSYTKYNDITWRKSNSFAGITGIIFGVITFSCSLILNGLMCTFVFLAILVVWLMICVVISYRIYMREKDKEKDVNYSNKNN